MYITNEFKHKLKLYKAKGGKLNRKRTVYRLNTFLNYCDKRGKKRPEEIGKKDVYNFFKEKNNLAKSTKRDYWYAIRVLWQFLDRPNDPPYPN